MRYPYLHLLYSFDNSLISGQRKSSELIDFPNYAKIFIFFMWGMGLETDKTTLPRISFITYWLLENFGKLFNTG